MKKSLFLLACLFALLAVVKADDDKPVRVNQLPQAAQQFINQNFAGRKVALAKMENDFWDKSYEVVFTNGDKVEFDKRGNWKDVNCKYSAVPAKIVPNAIARYVKSNYSSAKILEIDRDKKDYEVKLSNGWEIKFDLNFNVINLKH